MHPDSPTRDADLDNLKRKIDAGADRAITQFFFSADCFFRFRDAVAAAGIDIEIVPGILPVSNVATTRRFAADAAAPRSPTGWTSCSKGSTTCPSARQLVAATVAAELCGQLYAGGVRHFHFYTLNRAELSYAICHLLGVRANMSAAERPSRRGGQAHPDQGRRLRHADPGRAAAERRLSRRARPAQGPARQQRPAQPDPARADRARSASASPTRAPTSSPPTPSTPMRISQADYGAEALVPRHQPRRGADRPRGRRPLVRSATASRAGSRARSGRPTRPCRCRPTSTTRPIARSISTR